MHAPKKILIGIIAIIKNYFIQKILDQTLNGHPQYHWDKKRYMFKFRRSKTKHERVGEQISITNMRWWEYLGTAQTMYLMKGWVIMKSPEEWEGTRLGLAIPIHTQLRLSNQGQGWWWCHWVADAAADAAAGHFRHVSDRAAQPWPPLPVFQALIWALVLQHQY